ncbi:hypothetical protein BH23CHL4_BH23CHL4_26560 [soil metagenome]
MTVPIVPAGFHYARKDRWEVDLRFGEPAEQGAAKSTTDIVKHVETCVRRLSAEPDGEH